MTNNDGRTRRWPADAGKTAFEWIDPLTAAAVENPLNPGKQLISNVKGAFEKDNGPASAIASLPVPIPQTPITPANAEVLQAQKNYAQQTMGMNTVSDTIHAGNTGGYYPGEPGSPGQLPGGPKTYKGRGF
jgi:hypothetical protein